MINKAEIKHLKILPQYFVEVEKRNKRAELRKNDRDFKVGDLVWLEEWDGTSYTGRSCLVEILHIISNIEGLDPNYIIFSFKVLEDY